MAIKNTEEHGEEIVKIVWEVTFKREFDVGGRLFQPGDTMELDATLVKSGEEWLIDNF